MIISGTVLLRMKNVSYKIVEQIKTHVLLSVIFFSDTRAVYEMMWKTTVGPGRPQMTI
jgi:hypothetical protein